MGPAGKLAMPILSAPSDVFAGSVIWASLLAYAGYKLGENWEDLQAFFGPADIVIAALFLMGGLWYVFIQIKQAWEVKPSEPEA